MFGKICGSYTSLEGLEGTVVDEYGNLRLIAAPDATVRRKYEFLMEIDPKHLKGRLLSHTLNWIRWASPTSVKWDCTLPELLQLIEKWESVNVAKSLYSEYWSRDVTWGALWRECAKPMSVTELYPCPRCNKLLPSYTNCSACGLRTGRKNPVRLGPRGRETYDLFLEGHDGVSVAIAAYHSRSYERGIPPHLQVSI